MKSRYLLNLALWAAVPLSAAALEVEVDKSHDLWWNAPETPELCFAISDTTGAPYNSNLIFEITPDRRSLPALMSVAVPVQFPAGDTAQVSFRVPSIAPGFYRCTVKGPSADKPLKEFNFGYEPTNVVSLPDAPEDFDAFWEAAKAELKAVPGDFKRTELKDKSGKHRKIYLVEMTSLGGERIKGYLAEPIGEGKYPVHIYYNGYGSKPWCFEADARPDWIEFVVSSRGQFLSQPENRYGDWIRYNLDNPSDYYYRGAFMDCVRAIDYVAQLPKADTSRLYAEGGSQGGAYTLAAAALDDRLTAIAPYIPFLSDYRDYFDIVDWPASAVKEAAREKGMDENAMYANLRYFDIKNLARRISCPVLMGIGLQDPVCPPHTNMSSYNLITAPKELVIYPLMGHTVDYGDWSPRREEFFNKWR